MGIQIRAEYALRYVFETIQLLYIELSSSLTAVTNLEQHVDKLGKDNCSERIARLDGERIAQPMLAGNTSDSTGSRR